MVGKSILDGNCLGMFALFEKHIRYSRVMVLVTKMVELKLIKMLVMMLHKIAQRSLSSVQTG